jgi:dolichol-phosphate mannosyltransferase
MNSIAEERISLRLAEPRREKIAVVIPAYRAERHIAGVLRGIPGFVSWIVVVDDCSPDNTAEIVEEAARDDSRIVLIRHEVNQGVGGAMLTGYRAACQCDAEILVKMDSDGQMDPEQLLPLITPIAAGEADYCKGNRFLHARQLRQMSPVRRVGNLGLSLLTKATSGYWKIFDPTNGYTAMHASLFPLIEQSSIAKRYFFESSMLLELNLQGAVVRDVPMPSRYGDEVSNLSVAGALMQFPFALFKGLLRRIWIQYFVRDFGAASAYMAIGALLCLFGVLFGGYHWILSCESKIVASTGTVMLAVLPIVLGAQCLLQALSLDIQDQFSEPLHVKLSKQRAVADAISEQSDAGDEQTTAVLAGSWNPEKQPDPMRLSMLREIFGKKAV